MIRKPEISGRWIGFPLSRNLYSPYGVLVAPAGTCLTEEHLSILELHGIRLYDEDFLDPDTQLVLHEAISEVRRIFEAVRETGRLPDLPVARQLGSAAQRLKNGRDLGILLHELRKADDYTYRHSAAVTIFSSWLGEWLGLTQQERENITMSAFLHDIGKVNIPDSILNKPGKLTQQEYEEIKRHSQYGYDIILQSSSAYGDHALVALQHHEREDGGGYPNGALGKDIGLFSKIVAVADVFHAMCSSRAYKQPMPFYEVLGRMRANAFGKLDPIVVDCFLCHIMEILVGSSVELTNDTIVTIRWISPQDPLHPIVEKENGCLLDLAKHPNVAIRHIL